MLTLHNHVGVLPFPLPSSLPSLSSLPSPFPLPSLSLLSSPLLDSVVSATLGVSVLLGVREAGVYDRASVWGGGESGWSLMQ